MNQKIGYLRIFTENFKTQNQRESLQSAGCDLILEDKEKKSQPISLCMEILKPGDVLVVTNLQMLGRNLIDVLRVITSIAERGASLISLSEDLDSSSESGIPLVRMCHLLMECQQAFVREKNQIGLTASRARGRLGGRKKKLSQKDITQIKELLSHPENSVSDIAKKYGVSRTTIYKYVGVIVPERVL
jgi:DNA invertase Pin-like site-specific DNA recombinase